MQTPILNGVNPTNANACAVTFYARILQVANRGSSRDRVWIASDSPTNPVVNVGTLNR